MKLKAKFRANVDDRKHGMRTNWPAYDLLGQWAVTAPNVGHKPLLDCGYVVITHQPTGLRALDVRVDEDFGKVLRHYDRVFGKARTVRGVMRKYNALSKRQKLALKKYDVWATE